MQHEKTIPSLSELKKQFERCQLELTQHKHLMEKREFEMERLHKLKSSLEIKFTQLHHNGHNREKTENLKKKIAEESTAIDALKKIIRHIDSEIDHIGEEKEEEFAELKERIIEAVQRERPESREEYLTLKTQLQQWEKKKEQLVLQRKLTLPFFHSLNQACKIKLKPTFFGFIFGRNSKTQLARALHQSALLAESVLDKIENEPLRDFMNRFLHNTQKIWNKEIYSGGLAKYCDEMHSILSSFDNDIEACQRSIDAQNQAFNRWLAKYC